MIKTKMQYYLSAMLAGFTRSIHNEDFFRKVVLAKVMPSSTPGVFETSTSNGPVAFLTASKKVGCFGTYLCHRNSKNLVSFDFTMSFCYLCTL